VATPAQDKDVELHKAIDELVDKSVRDSVGPVTPDEREADLQALFQEVSYLSRLDHAS
jgi:hypothetical protein